MSVCIGDLTGPALRAFFAVARAWDLTEAEEIKLLGLTDEPTLKRWKAGRTRGATRDTLERISYVLGIYRSLNTLLSEPGRAPRGYGREIAPHSSGAPMRSLE